MDRLETGVVETSGNGCVDAEPEGDAETGAAGPEDTAGGELCVLIPAVRRISVEIISLSSTCKVSLVPNLILVDSNDNSWCALFYNACIANGWQWAL